VADQIDQIKKEYHEREKSIYERLRAAKDDQKKIVELNQESHEAVVKLARQLTAVIKAHGKEPVAATGIWVLVGELHYALDDDLVKLLLEHHLCNPDMGKICFELRSWSTQAWAEKILAETAVKHPQRAVRGQALYALGDYHRYRAQPWGEKLSEAEEAKRFATASAYFTEVAQAYADVSTPDGRARLGDKAASELTRIRNVPNLKVGKTAPDVEGEDLDGKRFKLSDYRGKVVVLDFWGHW
jgi:AhpC/TSA family